MSNTRNTPVEAIEHYLPVRIRQYALRKDSGGAGAFAGGDGLVREYEMLTDTSVTVLSERRRGRRTARRAASPGGVGRNTLIRDGREAGAAGQDRAAAARRAIACGSKRPAAADTAASLECQDDGE